MTQASPQVSEADLHTYLDGRLPPERHAAVAAYLASHPEEAARIDGYRRLNDALRQGYGGILEEPVPARLRRLTRRVTWPRRAAAALAWVALGGVIGWGLGAGGGSAPGFDERLVASATRAHAVYAVEVRHPVEVRADEEAHLSAWLSKRLGAELRPPQLGAVGYHLVGGRLLPGDEGPAAQFMYEDAGGHRLTLYVRRANEESGTTAFQYGHDGDVGVFYWIDGAFGYALSGELPREQLLGAARVTYQAFNP